MNINIGLSEFRNFVFNELEMYFEETVVGNEYCYEYNIGENFYVRILSSIDVENEKVRDDIDSIKIHIFDKSDNSIIESESHTKRTPGYRDRIKEKVNNLVECPECSENRRVSDGQYGKYFYCVNENCEYTESIE